MVCAEHMGISEKYLSDIERGDKLPRLETFVKMLNTLSASADDVLQDSLIMGYVAKSNDLQKRLEPLDTSRRRQLLEILDSIMDSLIDEKNHWVYLLNGSFQN